MPCNKYMLAPLDKDICCTCLGDSCINAMSADLKETTVNDCKKVIASEELQAKVNEIKRLVEPLPDKLSLYCSDGSISRHLKAQNWNVKKATKMVQETLKWRAEYKPEEIRWEEVAHEAETGKIYRSNYIDKHGRTVLVMRPCRQNSNSTTEQIKYLVYCMENAILNLPPGQEQMVWLVDFKGFSLSNISLTVTHEIAYVLQNHYPERLGLAILYNPPWLFESFFTMVKPFLEPETSNKVKFVYSGDPNTKTIMEDIFNMDHLESAFGGNDDTEFDLNKYADRMQEDDKKMSSFWTRGKFLSAVSHSVLSLDSNSIRLDSDYDASENEKIDCSPSNGIKSKAINPEA
ncbi:Random slug protein 5-like [Quillaja saponaria]|uniref:Random slug protein 5-like n=1 Tax=Quillaja saponaria TaxID=32244 RepID=A0AAD7LJ05_QUISA|nr:Random slug protein 5-like [Quillaja saponaria]